MGMQLERCNDERSKTCLMARFKNGEAYCNGLRDTSDCKFYKDASAMSTKELNAYANESYRVGYVAPNPEVVEANRKRGEAIRIAMEGKA